MDIEKTTIPSKEEFDAVEKEAENAQGVFTLEFGKPFTYEGFTAERLTFDFDKLTGADSLAVEHELQMLYGRPIVVREFTADYQIRIACRACTENVSVNFLLALPIRITNRLMSEVRSFLISAE